MKGIGTAIVLSMILLLGVWHVTQAREKEKTDPDGVETSGPLGNMSFRPGSEPDGFGGLKWGRDLRTLSGIKHVGTSEMGGSLPVDLWDFDRGGVIETVNMEVYVRPVDRLRIWGAAVRKIAYGFREGRLCEVTITTKGFGNFASLRKSAFKRFGEVRENGFAPHSSLGHAEETHWYLWAGKTSEMELTYTSGDEIGQMWIGSTVLRNGIFEGMRKRRGSN